MHNYSVRDRCQPLGLLVLFDAFGDHHIVRCAGDLPLLGVRLKGFPPSLGFGLLLDASTDQVYRVVFEIIGTDEKSASARLKEAGIRSAQAR